MLTAHQLDDSGEIINTIVVDSLDALPDLVDAVIGGHIGDRIVDGQLFPKDPVVPPVGAVDVGPITPTADLPQDDVAALREQVAELRSQVASLIAKLG